MHERDFRAVVEYSTFRLGFQANTSLHVYSTILKDKAIKGTLNKLMLTLFLHNIDMFLYRFRSIKVDFGKM